VLTKKVNDRLGWTLDRRELRQKVFRGERV
jgi:hypothetical protein